jgi:hypothetical protein
MNSQHLVIDEWEPESALRMIAMLQQSAAWKK